MVRSFSAEPGRSGRGRPDPPGRAALPDGRQHQGYGLGRPRGTGRRRPLYFDATTDETWRQPSPGWSDGLARAPVVLLAYTSPEAYVARYAEAGQGAHRAWATAQAAWPVPYWIGDAAFGVMTVLLAAVDAGLGACILGTFRGEAELGARLGVPDGWRLFCAVLLGHPDGRDHRSASVDRPRPHRLGADPPGPLGRTRLRRWSPWTRRARGLPASAPSPREGRRAG